MYLKKEEIVIFIKNVKILVDEIKKTTTNFYKPHMFNRIFFRKWNIQNRDTKTNYLVQLFIYNLKDFEQQMKNKLINLVKNQSFITEKNFPFLKYKKINDKLLKTNINLRLLSSNIKTFFDNIIQSSLLNLFFHNFINLKNHSIYGFYTIQALEGGKIEKSHVGRYRKKSKLHMKDLEDDQRDIKKLNSINKSLVKTPIVNEFKNSIKTKSKLVKQRNLTPLQKLKIKKKLIQKKYKTTQFNTKLKTGLTRELIHVFDEFKNDILSKIEVTSECIKSGKVDVEEKKIIKMTDNVIWIRSGMYDIFNHITTLKKELSHSKSDIPKLEIKLREYENFMCILETKYENMLSNICEHSVAKKTDEVLLDMDFYHNKRVVSLFEKLVKFNLQSKADDWGSLEKILKDLNFEDHLDNLDIKDFDVLIQLITDPPIKNIVLQAYQKRKNVLLNIKNDENLDIIKQKLKELQNKEIPQVDKEEDIQIKERSENIPEESNIDITIPEEKIKKPEKNQQIPPQSLEEDDDDDDVPELEEVPPEIPALIKIFPPPSSEESEKIKELKIIEKSKEVEEMPPMEELSKTTAMDNENVIEDMKTLIDEDPESEKYEDPVDGEFQGLE